MYYASAGMLSIVLHVIINFDVLRNSDFGMSSHVKSKYRHYLWTVLIYYAVDASWGFLYDLRIVPLTYAATVFFFLTMVLTLFLWMRFIVAFLGNINAFGKALHFMGICVLLIERALSSSISLYLMYLSSKKTATMSRDSYVT